MGLRRWRGRCAGCSATSTMQLHWVDAAALDHHSGPMKVEGWESYFKTLNANMTKFNSFMHNKQQLFVDDNSSGGEPSPLPSQWSP